MCSPFLLWSIVLIYFYGTVQIVSVNYCEIKSCKNPSEHTMCLYPTTDTSSHCKELKLTDNKMDPWQQTKVVQAHNRIRQKFASGGMSGPAPFGMGFPPAKNMPMLTWNDELATMAQHWVNQCIIKKDKCRNTEDWDNVGQLYFKKFYPELTASYPKDPSWVSAEGIYATYTNALALSLDEKMDIKNTENIKLPVLKALAQLLWDKVSMVGCARAYFQAKASSTSEKLHPIELMVCNYPSGDKLYGELYESGRPCASCSCNLNYTALCENSGALKVAIYPLVLNGLFWIRM